MRLLYVCARLKAMIALLTGKPTLINNRLIIDVNGVGYLVAVTNSTVQKLANQSIATIYTYTHVREEALDLYGFLSPSDQNLFELLLSVNGVGPKTALAISESGATRIATAVQEADVAFFSSVPRVGKKQAQKIIIELKGKLGSIQELELGSLPPEQQDVQDALLALGFEEQQILRLMKSVPANITTAEAVTWALKQAGRNT